MVYVDPDFENPPSDDEKDSNDFLKSVSSHCIILLTNLAIIGCWLFTGVLFVLVWTFVCWVLFVFSLDVK